MSQQGIEAEESAPYFDENTMAEHVADYLRQNPTFFEDRADLLVELTPPTRWSDDSIVDMQRFMVESLQGEIVGLRDCAQEVIETSRANMIVQTRTHDAVLAVVRCSTVPDLLSVIRGKVPGLLGIDAANIVAEQSDDLDLEAMEMTSLPAGALSGCMDSRGDIILINDSADARRLFGHDSATEVRSVAVVRLHAESIPTPSALLLGSCDIDGFHPDQGTELLAFLANIVAASLDQRVRALLPAS